MTALKRACKDALKDGKAEKVSETVISFTVTADSAKLKSFENSYATDFHKRWQSRLAKEQIAEKKLHDFIITY